MDSETSFSLDRAPTAVETEDAGEAGYEATMSDDEMVASMSSMRRVVSFQMESSGDEEAVANTKRKPRRRRPPVKGVAKTNGTYAGPRTRREGQVKTVQELLRGGNSPGSCSYCTRIPNVTHYRKPYHEYIRKLTVQGWPYLKRLDTFMNFAEHIGKKKLPLEVKQRWRAKLRLTVLDYCDTGVVLAESFNSTVLLRDYLAMDRPEQVKGRLFLVEDLSRDAIEVLGGALDVEPDFWEGHISGTAKLSGPNYVYGPYNVRVKFPPRLFANQKRHSHFRLDFVKFRTKTDIEDPIAAQADDFNIRRHSETMDEPLRNPEWMKEQVREQVWTDQRTSVLMLPNSANGWTGIVIFDPSFEDSQDPSPWKSRGFAEYPSFHSQVVPSNVFSNGRSDYEDFISLQLNNKSSEDVQAAISDAYFAVHDLFMLIASQWTACSASIWVQLGTLEERIQNNVGGDLESVLSVHVKDLLKWQNMVESYFLMVKLSIRQLRSGGNREGWKRADYTSPEHEMMKRVEKDVTEEFERLMEELRGFKERIERNIALFNASLSIEESKKAIKESESVSRLTKLAFVFIPLSYIASLFSIQGWGGPSSDNFWVYWAVSLPLTIFTFFAATLVTWLVGMFGVYFTTEYWRAKFPAIHPKARRKTFKQWLQQHLHWRRKKDPAKSIEEGGLSKRPTATESVLTRTTNGDWDEDKKDVSVLG